MKKTLLSVTAALAVIGSACAAPSVEDRKALCEKYPDKYVWVAKDEMCVPINPCESVNMTIKEAYCVEVNDFSFPKEPERLSLLLDRYTEKVLKSGVFATRELGEGYIALITLDGGYRVINPVKGYDNIGKYTSRFQEALGPALWAYGYKPYDCSDHDYKRGDIDNPYWIITCNITETECDDIRDFASLLGDYIFDNEYEDGKCWIISNISGRYKKS